MAVFDQVMGGMVAALISPEAIQVTEGKMVVQQYY